MSTKRERTDFIRRAEQAQELLGGLADELVEMARENNENEGAALESLQSAVDHLDDAVWTLRGAWEPKK